MSKVFYTMALQITYYNFKYALKFFDLKTKDLNNNKFFGLKT